MLINLRAFIATINALRNSITSVIDRNAFAGMTLELEATATTADSCGLFWYINNYVFSIMLFKIDNLYIYFKQ